MAQNDIVVILGGAGFIGRRLVEALRGKVAEIRAVSRKPWGVEQAGVRYLQGDVTDAARMIEIVEGATAVYHLTVEGSWTVGATNVAEACVAHRVRRMIFASTSDALFLGRSGTIYETDPPDPRPDLRNSYSAGKVASEKLLLEYRAKNGLGVVIMRPCIVVGRGGTLQHGGVGRWKSPTVMMGWGDGTKKMPFVLVQDVASAMALALDAPGIEGKAFNLGGDVFLSAREYVQIVAERTRRNFRFVPSNLYSVALEIVFKACVKRLVSGKWSEYSHYHDIASSAMLTAIDNSQSKRLLGWKPNASLEVFIREAIDSHAEEFRPGDRRLAG
jgi:nucleoside-diphosphate-sugar epimerase